MQNQTVRLVWEGMVGTDRMHRYYGYVLQKLERRNMILRFLAALLSSIALVGFFVANEWQYLLPVCSFVAAAVNLWLAERNYVNAAAHSLDIQRQLHRLMVEWKQLWADIDSQPESDIQTRWKSLADRTARVTEEASSKVPLIQSLAKRSQEEAYTYWSQVHA